MHVHIHTYIVHIMKSILVFENHTCVTHSRWISFRYNVTSTFFLSQAMGFRWPRKVKGKLTHQENESQQPLLEADLNEGMHGWTDKHRDTTY